MEFDKINFKKIKSSYLENDLKIKNVEKAKTNLYAKNDEIRKMLRSNNDVANSYNNLQSLEIISSKNDLHKKSDFNDLKSSIDDADSLIETECQKNDQKNKIWNSGKSDECIESMQTQDLTDEKNLQNLKEDEEARDITKGEINDKSQLSEFFNKTKNAYKSLNLENLFLCNNVNDLTNDKNSDILIGNYSNYTPKVRTNENKHIQNSMTNKLGITKTIERRVTKNKNTLPIEKIYNAFRGTISDFMDLYIQKEDRNIELIHAKLYETNNDLLHKPGIYLKNERNSDIEANIKGNSPILKKYYIGNAIFNSPKLDITNVKKELDQEKDKKNYAKNAINNNYNDSCKIPANSFYRKKEAFQKEKNNSEKFHERNLFYEKNILEASRYDTVSYFNKYEIKKDKPSNNNNNKGVIPSEVNKKNPRINKKCDKNVLSHDLDTEKYEYSNIISDYLYNQKNDKKLNMYGLSKKDYSNDKNEQDMEEIYCDNENDKTIDLQINDKNVLDISPLTHKYKYRSNIILTINKIKNIEKIIEINLNITDVQLKIPGMRIENVILPHKYSNDILNIQIKTLSEEDGNDIKTNKETRRKETTSYYQKSNKNSTQPNSDNMATKKSMVDGKTCSIKCYYVLIPLNNINYEIINKRLILINSTNKEMYEKENLLPDTIYLIQSKSISSIKEKYMYISIKKCVNGIYLYPILNENILNDFNKNPMINSQNSNSIFKPAYVSLYNDEIDREVGKFINANKLINKIKIKKLPEKGYYIINDICFRFFFDKNNILVCVDNSRTSQIGQSLEVGHTGHVETANYIFDLMSKNFIIVKSSLDLFPSHIFPLIEQVVYFDFIEKNELLKLKFIMHFLAITEAICTNLCFLFNINVQIDSLFYKNLKAVQIKDENDQNNFFTFLYTSYEERIQNNGKYCPYFLNYSKPLIFRFQSENELNNMSDANGEEEIKKRKEIEKGIKLLKKTNDNDFFIYDYARKQSIFLYNAIKNDDAIKNIENNYDKKKQIFYTHSYTKKQFQDYYMNILNRYNQLLQKEKCKEDYACRQEVETLQSNTRDPQNVKSYFNKNDNNIFSDGLNQFDNCNEKRRDNIIKSNNNEEWQDNKYTDGYQNSNKTFSDKKYEQNIPNLNNNFSNTHPVNHNMDYVFTKDKCLTKIQKESIHDEFPYEEYNKHAKEEDDNFHSYKIYDSMSIPHDIQSMDLPYEFQNVEDIKKSIEKNNNISSSFSGFSSFGIEKGTDINDYSEKEDNIREIDMDRHQNVNFIEYNKKYCTQKNGNNFSKQIYENDQEYFKNQDFSYYCNQDNNLNKNYMNEYESIQSDNKNVSDSNSFDNRCKLVRQNANKF
ncbi:hypothetical protein YYG_01364 [Plasmodium vinckei petteri]|uniref:Uncharacterized protein n=1 Tax=Plasmodium vinckei petteri TaxID=138298 RepID=W7AXH3_PLAVN|nr:hypothetical protein YYG_01364 [Plasmodium vinckei petteri]CAD2108618.1 conserved Plasmodium protein, unknown function [Plasmodium vinckei petteri]